MPLNLFNLRKLRGQSLLKIPHLLSNSLSSLIQNTDSITSTSPHVSTIFHIITNSPSPESMIGSLNSSQIPLSNELIDQVLKRVRFSHASVLKTLEFFNFVGQNRGFYHTSYSYDTMLYILGRSRKFDEIWKVLREMKRKDPKFITPKTVMIVLGRIAKVCSVRQTVESFRKFKRLCTDFDASCFNALLRTLCQEKNMTDARNVYHALKHDFKPNLITFNILLSGWKSVEEAESFFDEMSELKITPDLVTYNCLIDVYCKNRELDKAHKVFDKMRENEIYPDVISYTSLIGGLGLIGQPDKARNILKEMKELSIYPDTAAYNATIRNFCIAKRLGDAFALMDEMGQTGLTPNATSFNLFFRCFYWANDLRNAWSLYKRMREKDNCLPNTQTCMFLIRLFKRHENADMAMELWNDMVQNGFGSLTLVSDVLFDLLCDEGRLDEAERCLFQMVEKGQRPSHVSVKRIRVLMELANRQESLCKLREVVGHFENRVENNRGSFQPIQILNRVNFGSIHKPSLSLSLRSLRRKIEANKTKIRRKNRKKMPSLQTALPPELANNVLRLYKECLRRAKYIGQKKHNTELLVTMVRDQFKRHKNETDPEKIQNLKDNAARGLINHMLYESENMSGRKFSGQK
ncbi:hypothetical protein LUZ60_015812 [Juncus effusus]|nr:hypothetical protein LUZ60_015812 [Juncus effusus]